MEKTAFSSEIISIGIDLFDSEDLSERLYKSLLDLLSDGFVGNDQGPRFNDLMSAYQSGFYLPCCRREILRGQIDLLNDELPEIASFIWNDDDEGSSLIICKQTKPPKDGTSCPIIGTTYSVSLVFRKKDNERIVRKKIGCNAEHIKSLFYARQAPIAESGRKRPILHWVRAHNRRIQAGIDIDISKHLRGIAAFEMDGLVFKITNPVKSGKKTGPGEL